MTPDALRTFLEQVRGQVESAMDPSAGSATRGFWGRGTVEVAFMATRREDGGYQLEPCIGGAEPRDGSVVAHRLILDFPGPAVAGLGGGADVYPRSRDTRVAGGANPAASPRPAFEPGTGGDPATLRRRLEFVLGGPPGFNRGAQAEILADLLREFGRAELLGALERDWIPQFDTGPDSSLSVTKIP